MSRRRILHTGADLRYGLTRVRDSAEEIALGQGAQREHGTAVGLFHRQVNAVWSNRLVHVRYGVSVGILEHFPALVLWLLMMNDIVHGSLGIGDALRVHFAYDQIGKVLGFVIQNFDQCTNLQADADRLHHLLKACDGPNNAAAYTTTQIDLQQSRPGEAFAAEDVYVHPPDMQGTALGGVDLTLAEGQALLVMGPSGVGKTAILRAVAGLWRNGTGAVRRPGGPAREGIRFIPNRVYLPQGTLVDLVKYPLDECCCQTAEAALRRANLGHLIKEWGLTTSRDWKPLLSPGEQQRVGFARLFASIAYSSKNSVLAVLDEATGALDVPTERMLYLELRSELRSGGLRGVLSVGHRIGLRDFHDALLCIGEHDQTGTPIKGGTWSSPTGMLEWQLYKDLLVLPPGR
jgi:putative ATP-binding cassette transporter